jgi:hypothetical protein
MADEMMVLLRFGGDADDLLPRYLGAVKRWREDDATKNFSPPLMAAHMKTQDGLLVMNLWANDEDHKNFGLKMGPSLEAEALTRPMGGSVSSTFGANLNLRTQLWQVSTKPQSDTPNREILGHRRPRA